MKFCFNLDSHMRDLVFSPAALARLDAFVELKPDAPPPGALTPAWLRAQAADCEGLISGWGALPLDDVLLAAAPELRLALHAAGSIKCFETEAMWRRGVRVTSAANVNAIPVAEFALGLVLMCLRNVWQSLDRFRREAGPSAWRHPPIFGYHGSTVGIIGMGNVGKHLLGLLGAFDFKVLAHSFYPFEKEAAAAGAELVEMDELLARADAVVLLAPNLPQYVGMIDARRLALLRDGTFFINVARGALVDEAALLAELQSGRITACLDVTDPEPPATGSAFYTLPNCILTPHIAGSAAVECRLMGDQVVRELEHFLRGENFDNEVTEELAHLIA